ncbi:MAG TPA: hypothetical protein VGI17_04610 [Solirubrobacterales bacterium]
MRAAIVAAAALALVALGFPALVAAESAPSDESTPLTESTTSGEGAVLGTFETTPLEALLYWTPARIENAEPLPIPILPGGPPAGEGGGVETTSAESTLAETPPVETAPGEAAPGASTAALRSAVAGQTSAVEGFPSADPTVFPDSTNGKVLGAYKVGSELKGYECSGSVVGSPAGNVVVTAGHCVIDPETGGIARFLIFVPGYREGSEPYGRWAAEFYATTESWEATAKPGSTPNEGGDVAMLVLHSKFNGTEIEEETGGLGIGFDQACSQTYTQWGYPGEFPYNGDLLYTHTTPYAGADTSPNFSPEPIKIASDFTQGASGGPWTVGPGTAPTVVSVTDYGYEDQPGFLYGAYFGRAVRAAYLRALGQKQPSDDPGTEEACKPLPPPTPPPEPTPTSPGPTQPTPAKKKPTLKVKKIHRRADGSAVVTAKVGSAGKLKLTGTAVRADSLKAPDAGNYKLVVAPRGVASRKLKRQGGAKVGVKISFAASGTVRKVSKKILLSRR